MIFQKINQTRKEKCFCRTTQNLFINYEIFFVKKLLMERIVSILNFELKAHHRIYYLF